MKLLKKNIFKITGTKVIQNLLEKNILLSQKLMGIGSGTDVKNSGEEILLTKLLELNTPEVTVFDVGANKGDFSEMVISSLSGKINLNLHCFEPSRSSFEKLKNKVKSSDKITISNFALGRKEEESKLYYEKAGSGLASLTKRRLDHFNINFTESEKILVRTLDQYCESKNINHIDLLKIDVEGHELDVLSGSIKMFENKSIKMVSFEFGGCNIDTRTYYQDFHYFFKNFNMDIYRITPSGNPVLMVEYLEVYEQFRTTNYFVTGIIK